METYTEVTLKKLIQHGKRFGNEGVLELAAECGFGKADLAKLLAELDGFDPKHPALPRTWKKRKLTAEERVSRFLLGETDTEEETT